MCDRLYVLLSPKGEDPVAPKQWVKLAKEGPSPAAVINHKTHPLHKRLLVIPLKKLPDIDQHERLLGAWFCICCYYFGFYIIIIIIL